MKAGLPLLKSMRLGRVLRCLQMQPFRWKGRVLACTVWTFQVASAFLSTVVAHTTRHGRGGRRCHVA